MTIDQMMDAAVRSHQAGRLIEAETLYKQILEQRPQHADALHLLGVLSGQTNRLEIAIELVRKAIAVAPRIAEYHSNLGKFLADRGDPEGAIAAYRAALRLKPALAEAHNNLGNILKQKGRFDEALAHYRHALAVRKGGAYAEPHYNMGNTLAEMGKMDEAILAYQTAMALRPAHAGTYSGLANALIFRGRLKEATAACREAIRLDPSLSEAYSNLGNALRDLRQYDEAMAAYRHAMALKPADAIAHSNLLLAMNYDPRCGPPAILAEAQEWNRRHGPGPDAPPSRPLNDPSPERKLRIGFVSPDFSGHPVGRFLLPLFEHHDRTRMEFIAYSDVRVPDEMTLSFQKHAQAWHGMTGMPDAAATEMIRSHQIDILIDLAGHTAYNRLPLFAHRAAPLQASYLGYPATTGVAAMDYRITDDLADPPGMTQGHYAEALWRMEGSAWCYAPPADAPPLPDRSEPTGGPQTVCFGSFNNAAKLSPLVMEWWAQILGAVPDSRLLIKGKGLAEPETQQQIAAIFAARGISSARLDLRGWTPGRHAHLASYAEIDIALDTYPYHGTTTTCEALWMGVPVVTLAGTSHVSRVGVSLLTSVGLPELVARSPEEYVAIATALARDPSRRQRPGDWRDQLRRSPLMDGPAIAKHFEATCRRLWQQWCARHPQR